MKLIKFLVCLTSFSFLSVRSFAFNECTSFIHEKHNRKARSRLQSAADLTPLVQWRSWSSRIIAMWLCVRIRASFLTALMLSCKRKKKTVLTANKSVGLLTMFHWNKHVIRVEICWNPLYYKNASASRRLHVLNSDAERNGFSFISQSLEHTRKKSPYTLANKRWHTETQTRLVQIVTGFKSRKREREKSQHDSSSKAISQQPQTGCCISKAQLVVWPAGCSWVMAVIWCQVSPKGEHASGGTSLWCRINLAAEWAGMAAHTGA